MAFDGDEERLAQAREVAELCVNVSDNDRCEAAFKMLTCGMEMAKSKGYMNGFFV